MACQSRSVVSEKVGDCTVCRTDSQDRIIIPQNRSRMTRETWQATPHPALCQAILLRCTDVDCFLLESQKGCDALSRSAFCPGGHRGVFRNRHQRKFRKFRFPRFQIEFPFRVSSLNISETVAHFLVRLILCEHEQVLRGFVSHAPSDTSLRVLRL
jgi:hypothetical protein